MNEEQERKHIYRNGMLMAMARPDNPEDAIAMSDKARTQEDFNAILALPHRYVGLPMSDGALVDEEGKVVGKIEHGDSFVAVADIADTKLGEQITFVRSIRGNRGNKYAERLPGKR